MTHIATVANRLPFQQTMNLSTRPPAIALHWLRFAVAVQCFGNAWSLAWGLAWDVTNPLLPLLWEPSDVGGWALGERTALVVCRWVASLLVLCGFVVLIRPGAIVLTIVATIQLLFAVAMWQMGEGYPSELASIAPGFAPALPLATQAVRIAAPLVLWLVDSGKHARLAELLSRWAVALTFAGHGIEALVHYHEFCDMLIVAARKSGWDLSQTIADHTLTFIGVVDVALATLIVSTRRLSVAGYMAFWGLVTAASRIVVKGWYYGWDGTATRLVHFAIPLLLFLWWQTSQRVESSRESIASTGELNHA